MAERYQIIRSLGKGGMGEVFLAYDTIEQKNVALKRLGTTKKPSQARKERFLKEAHITRQLTHSAVVPIYHIESSGDLPYYTMPFIEGKTLKELLAEPQDHVVTSVQSLSHIFLRICQAVAYAHSKGFVHCDLKPSNIMIDAYGDVFIMDWGLVEQTQTQTQTPKNSQKKRAKVSGTMAYLAPEMLHDGKPTFQSEVYALGMVLYQMLTLRHPFHRSNMEEYCCNLEREVLIDPTIVAPYRKIPPALAHIACKCLDPLPANRYSSVEELIHDLETCFEDREGWMKVEPAKRNFTAGVALLEHAKATKKKNHFVKAIREFEKALGTEATPFAYLGKALVYAAQNNMNEEASAYEQVFRSYHNHPLIGDVQMALMSRLSAVVLWPECFAAKMFLVALLYIPQNMLSVPAQKAFKLFAKHLEPQFFLAKNEIKNWSPELQRLALGIRLAFYASMPLAIKEILEETLRLMPAPLPIVQDGLMALIELEELDVAEGFLERLYERKLDVQALAKLDLIGKALFVHQKGFADKQQLGALPKSLVGEHLQPIWHILETALEQHHPKAVHEVAKVLEGHSLSDEQHCQLDCYRLWAFLLEGDVKCAGKLLKQYHPKTYIHKANTFNFLYGCWQAATKGKAAALKHFSRLNRKKVPERWQRFLMALQGKKSSQEKHKTCTWELKRLNRRISLFSACVRK